MERHPNATWFADHQAALLAGDIQKWMSAFDDSMELHVPHALPWSPNGLRGANAIIQLWLTMMKWTNNQFDNRVMEIVGGERLVVTLNRVTATRRGQTKSWDTVWTYRLLGDKIVEAFLLPSLGSEEVAAFWASDE
jgi:SnoaL-like domain